MSASFSKNLVPAILLLASIWVFFGFISPEYSKIQDLRAQEAQFRTAIDNANQIRILRNARLAELDSVPASDKEKLEKLLPDKIDGVKLMLDLSGIAAGFGIKIGSFEIKSLDQQADLSNPGVASAAPEQPYKTIQVDLSFKSTYSDFENFMRELEKNLELTEVTAVSVSGSNGKAGQETHDFRMTLFTYALK